MSDVQAFRLDTVRGRDAAKLAILGAPDTHEVVIRPAKRTLDQNSKFHALCSDIAKARPEYAGLPMDADDWKALLIVSHAKATKNESAIRLAPDLEDGSFVQLRESSARMDKGRASSLIEYAIAWATKQGIQLKDRR